MNGLRELRESRGMSQHYVAVKVDVTDTCVSRWECGRSNPLRKYRERMAALYGVSTETVDALLTGCQPKEASDETPHG